MEDIKLRNHFTFLIYPFLHSLTDEGSIVCPNELQSNWRLRWSQLQEVSTAIDDTFFFLPYVRSLIFPETALLNDALPGDKFDQWAQEIKSWDRQITTDFRAFRAKLNPDALLWLRLDKERLKPLERFIVLDEFGKHPLEIRAKLSYIESMLFPTGLGLLILKISLDEDSEEEANAPQQAASFSKLIDLNYYLRMVHAPTVNFYLPKLLFPIIDENNQPGKCCLSMRDLMDFLLQGMVDTDHKVESNLTKFKERLQSQRKRYTATDAGQVYGERCHLFTYACIDAGQADPAAKGTFDSVEDRLLYEFATCTESGGSIGASAYAPSPNEAQRMIAENRIFVWNCWRGLALKDNVAFLATEEIAFNKTVLPHNIENDYLPLYLYSLYQKYQLFVFAEDMVRKVADIQANLREVRKLADHFASFRNKYWFNEITRKPLGNELYGKFHKGLDTQSLYQLVSNEVSQIQEFYESKNNKNTTALLNFLTFVFLPLGAVISAFGMNFVDGSWTKLAVACAIVASISFLFWAVWNTWMRK